MKTLKKKPPDATATASITVRHQGGGNKRKYRIIDFKSRDMKGAATVIGIEYDPNSTAYIALLSDA